MAPPAGGNLASLQDVSIGQSPRVLVLLGDDAVRQGMACAGVVDADPGRYPKSRPQYVTAHGHEAVLASDQQPHHLTLRDVDADGTQLCYRPRNRDLSVLVLSQREAAQLGFELARQVDRRRREDAPPLGRQPTLSAKTDHRARSTRSRILKLCLMADAASLTNTTAV